MPAARCQRDPETPWRKLKSEDQDGASAASIILSSGTVSTGQLLSLFFASCLSFFLFLRCLIFTFLADTQLRSLVEKSRARCASTDYNLPIIEENCSISASNFT